MTEVLAWDLLLRGTVGGVLLFHAANLLGRGPRPAARAALWMFTLSLLAYLGCQRAELLVRIPTPLVWGVLALCTSSTAWLWLAARALFDDHFRWDWPRVGAGAGMIALGLASNGPRLDAMLGGSADPGPGPLTPWHAIAMLAFTAAAVWEVLRGWRDDLVEPRRVARRWVALGIGVYAAIALVVELAVRELPVGPLLPALHVAGIGIVALALALLVARRSLDTVLGLAPAPDVERPAGEPAASAFPEALPRPDPTPAAASPAMQRLAWGRAGAKPPERRRRRVRLQAARRQARAQARERCQATAAPRAGQAPAPRSRCRPRAVPAAAGRPAARARRVRPPGQSRHTRRCPGPPSGAPRGAARPGRLASHEAPPIPPRR